MPQDDALYEDVTAEENLRFFAALYGVKGEHLARRMDELFAFVRLQRHRKKLVHDYSGGMKRRVAIARALISKPAIVLADEPTGNLDSQNGAEVMALLRQICDMGKSVVLVTHNMEDAKNADNLILMKDGVAEMKEGGLE